MTTGVGVFCVVRGARPYPELGPPETREDFDFMSLDRDGRPADSPFSGEWFCSGYFKRIGGCCGMGSRPNGSRQTRIPHPARPRHDRTLESRSRCTCHANRNGARLHGAWPGDLGGPVHSTYLRRLHSLGHA